jgi:hypothetical protein
MRVADVLVSMRTIHGDRAKGEDAIRPVKAD